MVEMTWDRMVCGVNQGGIQQHLLLRRILSFKNAFDLEQAIEAAEKNNKIQKNSSASSQELHYSSSGLPADERAKGLTSKKGTPTCHQCWGPHLALVCKCEIQFASCCKKKG